MSGIFTGIRNAVETAGVLVGNYILPGSSLVTDHLVSKGSQQQLGSTLGQLAQLGTGIAGGSGFGGDTIGDRASTVANLSGFGNTTGTAAAGQLSGLTGGDATQFGEASSISPAASDSAQFGTTGVTPEQSDSLQFQNNPGTTETGVDVSGSGATSRPMSFSDMVKSATGGDFKAVMAYLGQQGGSLGHMVGIGGQAGAGPLGSFGSLAQLGTGLYGIYEGDQLKKQAQLLAGQADPFASQRGQYAAQLSALNANPGAVLPTLPGYQAGLDAVQRSLAAQGYTGSGNMMAALQQYGGNAYQQESARLAGLAGANANPGTGASLSLAGTAGGLNLTLNSLGMISKGLGATGA